MRRIGAVVFGYVWIVVVCLLTMMAHRNGGRSKNAIISNEKRCRGLTPLVWHKCIVLRVPSIREILILPLVSTLPTNPCKIEGTLEPLLGVALWDIYSRTEKFAR